jgi:predicted nucleic acid-binding protein
VYVEVHLVLCARRRADAAVVFGRALLAGTHSLDRPTDGEHGRALDLVERYVQSGLDLVDAIVMAIAATRGGLILTWDFRHFRAAVPARRRHWPLLVQEHEVPNP